MYSYTELRNLVDKALLNMAKPGIIVPNGIGISKQVFGLFEFDPIQVSGSETKYVLREGYELHELPDNWYAVLEAEGVTFIHAAGYVAVKQPPEYLLVNLYLANKVSTIY